MDDIGGLARRLAVARHRLHAVLLARAFGPHPLGGGNGEADATREQLGGESGQLTWRS